METITLDLKSVIQLNDDQFYELYWKNPEVKFERNVEEKLVVIFSPGRETRKQNFEIGLELGI